MMRTTVHSRTTPVGDTVLNASRQVWLASLGAAVVTRDWAQSEAGNVFRTLVKEGTAIESRTIRLVGDRIETSFAAANTLWRRARGTVQSTVRQAADTAVTLVQNNLPKSLPKVTLPAMLAPVAKPKARAKKRAPAKRAAKARVARTVKRGKRVAKSATGK
ncbi:MAG: phasin family protein [Burkholderiales bacterium]